VARRRGPLLKNNLYLGEVYDARRDQPGWDAPGFDARAWPAAVAAPAPAGRLAAQDVPPIKVGRLVRPVAVREPRPGVFIVDMGENFAGRVAMRVRGPAGTRVRCATARRSGPMARSTCSPAPSAR
jgi:alpha-L-rhamnosidase